MKRKKVIILSSFTIILLVFVIIVYGSRYKKQVYSENENNEIRAGASISMMIETKAGSGNYEVSTSSEWPTDGYMFNANLSKCENGGELSWNDETKSVVLTTGVSDKCYVYFDIVPPDVSIAASNVPKTYGKLGSINCDNSTTTYNQQYNRVEISQINGKYTSCTLNYADSTSKVNLATYITALAGTTQGTGQVVKETANIPDYSSAVAISQSAYTSQSVFSSTSYTSTSGTAVSGAYTFTNNTWTSVPSAMKSGTYYHFKFNPSENGYYQMCYDLSAGSANNSLYADVNDTQKYFGSSSYLSASTSATKSGCIELGYVTTSQYIKVTQRAYTNISTLSFSIKKAVTVNSITAGTRYEGINPNNYVWFNNEYWRIIGVFDNGSHGQSGKNLAKIIRADVLDGIAWHKSNTNDWTAASLNKLLNGAYYNAKDGTSSGYCYGYSSISINCDYTKKGIQAGYRSMIANVTWYLGGYSNEVATTESFYGYERGTTVYSGRPTTTTGYIGLMYPSDYGYSVLSSSCARTTNLDFYRSSTCAGQSWLYGRGIEWTLTPYSSRSDIVFGESSNGGLSNGNANSGYGARPVLYLDASVYKIDGEGTLDKPYIIGM